MLQLPWSEYKEPYAIMYQLGKGERPSIPPTALSEEGHRFLNKCLTYNVDDRPTAIDLSSDPFVKVRRPCILELEWNNVRLERVMLDIGKIRQ